MGSIISRRETFELYSQGSAHVFTTLHDIKIQNGNLLRAIFKERVEQCWDTVEQWNTDHGNELLTLLGLSGKGS